MRASCAENLRPEVERVRRHRLVDRHRGSILAERALELGRAGGAVVRVIMEQGDL
jgi:hypothetical protein